MFKATNSNAIISKPKKISQFFSAFPESIYNLEYFQKTVEAQRGYPSEIIDWKKQIYLNSQKATVSEHL